MTYLLLQTFLLLAASYFTGALLACLVKRAFFAGRAVRARAEVVPAAVVIPERGVVLQPQPVRHGRPARVAPRPFDPVQPKIEVFKRPEPRPLPKLVDPSRFERALLGPDPNEGMPRRGLVELRPAVLKAPTVAAERSAPPVVKPAPPPKPPASQPVPSLAKMVIQEVAKAAATAAPPAPAQSEARKGGPSDATTAAAAAAVAASKAAAAAAAASTSQNAPAKPAAVAQVPPPPPPPPPPVPPTLTLVENKPTAPALPDPPILDGDDFQRIRAIDYATEQRLKALGVLHFDHIAAWSAADIKRIGQMLDINGRIDREQWIEQAQILAKGGETYYSRNRAAAQKPAASKPAESAGSTPPPINPAPATGTSAKPPEPPLATPPPPPPSASGPPAPTPTASGPAEVASTTAGSGKSVAEMAHAAAAAIAAASASVTRGLRPIEPISPLSKVDPKISIPARLSDAIKERAAQGTAETAPAKPETATTSGTKPSGPADDLKRIRGIGVLIEKRLNGVGITRYEHIANFSNSDIDRISQMLEFKGRIERESWVEQARILASGGQTEFSRRVDRGEVDHGREE